MKSLFLVTATLFIVSNAPANSEEPILYKGSHSGLAPRHLSVSENCKVFTTGVIKKREVGGISIAESTRTILGGFKELQELIALASKQELVSESAPTDGPTTTWAAAIKNSDGSYSLVQLKATGSLRHQRQGLEAVHLINLIDQVCK